MTSRTTSRNVWHALPRPGFLLSWWPWRSVAYLLSSVLVGAFALLAIVLVAVTGGALAFVLVGLPLLALTALFGIPVAAMERRRLRLIDRDPALDLHRAPAGPGLRNWVTTRFQEELTWRELGFALLFAVLLWPIDAIAVVTGLVLPLSVVATPVLMATAGDGRQVTVLKQWTVTSGPEACAAALIGLVLFVAGCYAMSLVAGARAELTRLVIAPRVDAVGDRVTELVRSRVRLVDAFEAERRRIERDLHDGAQQRIVALTMTLGLARLDAPAGPLADQLAKAHGEAGKALAELRELIHGIHPKVLADYGLEAAVADAADRSAVPVEVELELAGRLPEPVEAAAYFVVCEALANVAKHSGAQRAQVSGGHSGGRLFLEIRDDGRGGANPDGEGTGLTGLADRISVLDGRLALSSPLGGPTLLRVEFPCEWTDRCV
ncbi:sensor histidine kinase [Streptomyces sp. NPDC102360]|uniref:sensor histidine kinase n=1 Tax=Streptomyces sp. NPDC102360 TaxID=3366160 RepID=UPI00382E9B84